MPFGPYADFEECVADNQDKDNPEAYCAALHYEITGSWPSEKGVSVDKLYMTQKQIESIVAAWPEWAGSYTECVSALSGKPGIDDAEALCAWLHKEAEGEWPGEKSEISLSGPIIYKNKSLQIVTAPVLVPGETDSDGEVVNAKKIEEVCLKWMQDYQSVDVAHSLNNVAVPVENWLLREDTVIDDLHLPKGTWMLSVKIVDNKVWSDILSNKYKGFSVTGVPRSVYTEAMKSKDPGKIISEKARKTLLRDLGAEWFALTVSIVEDPAVFKSKWIAIKSRGVSFWDRLRSRLNITNKSNEEEEKEMDEKQIAELVANSLEEALKPFSERLDVMEKGAEKDKGDGDDDKDKPDVDARVENLEKQVKDLTDKGVALTEAFSGKEKKTTDDKGDEITPEGVKAMRDKVGELEKFKTDVEAKFAPKSKKPEGQDGGDEKPPTAEKDTGPKRDFTGRVIRV